MKKIKKLLLILSMLIVTISLNCPNTFAGELRKGSVRVVVFDKETSACEHELVYNGNRYLPVEYYINSACLGLDTINGFSYGTFKLSSAKWNNNALTVCVYPTGYITFFAGSTKVRTGSDNYLKHPAAMYDGRMYISLDDIVAMLSVACGFDVNYGFDSSKNTIYIY